MSDLNQPSTRSSAQPRSRPKRNHQAEDDDLNNHKNSRTAPEDGSRPLGVSQVGMPLPSSSTWNNVGSSGELTQHNSNSGNGDRDSGQSSVTKRFRPGSHVTGGNSDKAVLPTNGVAVAAQVNTENQSKPVFQIDWDALDAPPELFDQNGDRQSLISSGGKRAKANQLPPPTYLSNIGSIRNVENPKDSFSNDTSSELLRRLHRLLDEKDLKNYYPTKGECLICSNEHCLLVIPQCPCRQPCCHSCMFSHLESSNARGQEFLCPFCQQPPVRLFYNIKTTRDYRYWAVPKFAKFAFNALYPLIRAIGLLTFENSELCGEVSPLCRITYASFISAFTRTPETENLLSLSPKQWFRAFVYIHDLIPWNYSAAQCTLPLPLCDEHVKHELDRLTDFLGAELCYFYSTLNLPNDFEMHEGINMNCVLVMMRTLVNDYASVQEYFERGEHFQNEFTKLLPYRWIIDDLLVDFQIDVPKKIYTESLYFLNSRAPSLDTYIKRVIYTNRPSDQLAYDPCLSRRKSRILRNGLLEVSNARLGAKLEVHEEREHQQETQDRLQQSSISDYRLERHPQEEPNEYEAEEEELDLVNFAEIFRDEFARSHNESTFLLPGQIVVNQNPRILDSYIRPTISPLQGGQNRSAGLDLWGFRPRYQVVNGSQSLWANSNLTAAGPSGSQVIDNHANESTANAMRSNDSLQSGEVASHSPVPESSSVAANDEREIGLSSNVSAVSRDIDSQPALAGSSSSSSASSELAVSSAEGNRRLSHGERVNQIMAAFARNGSSTVAPTPASSTVTVPQPQPSLPRAVASTSTAPLISSLNDSAEAAQPSAFPLSIRRERESINLSAPRSYTPRPRARLGPTNANSNQNSSGQFLPELRQPNWFPIIRLNESASSWSSSSSSASSASEDPITEEIPPFDGEKAENLRTASLDLGPGYSYFMRRIYPEESDGDSDSDDEYIMRGNPSQWRRAKRSNLLHNGSSSSGSTNCGPDRKSSVPPWIRSTSGINNSRQQDDQVPSRDVASTSTVHLEYSDSDSD